MESRTRRCLRKIPAIMSASAAPRLPHSAGSPRTAASYAPPGVGAYWHTALKGHNQVIVAAWIANGTTNVKVTLWTYVGANK